MTPPSSTLGLGLVLALAVLGLGGPVQAAEPPGAPPVHAPSRDDGAWIGVALGSRPATSREPAGVLAKHVVRGGPAHAAGLRDGDRVLRVGGAVVSTPEELVRRVREAGVGQSLALAVARPSGNVTVDVKVSARPSPHEVVRMDLVGRAAPKLQGTPVGRAPRSLDELRGKVVILDFWAPWCGPCRASMPRLDALASRLGAQGVKVVGVAEDTTPDRAQVAADKLGAHYPIVADDEGATMRDYGLSALPSLVVVDPKGVVREVLVGWDPAFEGQLATLAQTLLAEP